MKIFLFLFISLNISFASYEQVRIGKIDSYYKNKISEQELLFLLKEIENLFESELKTNVFDYSENGKPIDILHVSNKQLEENLSKKIEKLDNKKERDIFLKETNENKVMTRPIWQLIFKSPIYSSFQKDAQENAIYLEERIVNIPSSVR